MQFLLTYCSGTLYDILSKRFKFFIQQGFLHTKLNKKTICFTNLSVYSKFPLFEQKIFKMQFHTFYITLRIIIDGIKPTDRNNDNIQDKQY